MARTLAQGRLPGTIQVAWAAGPFRVRHATDANGDPMLLCRTGSALSRALAPQQGEDVAAVLRVESAGVRVWVSGWAHLIHGIALRRAALEFADVNPQGDLLDLGLLDLGLLDLGSLPTRGGSFTPSGAFELHHLDVAEVRLERNGELAEVDADAYAAAVPV